MTRARAKVTRGQKLRRLSEALLLISIFCLPFSAVWILSTNLAEVGGAFNTFAVPKIYATEVLVIVASVMAIIARPPKLRGRTQVLLAVVAGSAASALWSASPLLAFTSFVHLAAALLFLLALTTHLADRSFARRAAMVFVATATVQAVWALAQYGVQHDLGLRWLGESLLNPDIQGVAKVVTDGERHIRGYGSLPHPNVLAAYLSAAIFIAGSWILWPEISRHKRIILSVVLMVLGAGLLVTFSRVALILTLVNGSLVIAFTYQRWRRLPREAILAAVAFIAMAAILTQPLMSRATLNSAQETGVTNRTVGYEAALSMAGRQPYGVGAGNFVLEVDRFKPGLPPYQQQPAHNALLLIAAELGVLASLFVLGYIIRLGWRFHRLTPSSQYDDAINLSLFMACGVFIGMGMVDHFFWSLPAGLLLASAAAAAAESRLSTPNGTVAGK